MNNDPVLLPASGGQPRRQRGATLLDVTALLAAAPLAGAVLALAPRRSPPRYRSPRTPPPGTPAQPSTETTRAAPRPSSGGSAP